MVAELVGFSLPQLARFLERGLELWLLALAIIVAWRLLVVGHLWNSLLSTTLGGAMEADRLQMFVAAATAGAAYVATCAQQLQHAELVRRMPDVPNELLIVMAASQAIYLGGKMGRLRPTGA